MSSTENNAAHLLEGLELEGGWVVEEKIVRAADSSGGHFSVGYFAGSTDGRRGFLKALDYTRAFQAPDFTKILEEMLAAFNYERDLLRRCDRAGLSRIVRVLDDGVVTVNGASGVPQVSYLIFERASGDIRHFMAVSDALDVVLTFRTLHNVAAGLQQLHNHEIAHQDLKPSNVLIFSDQSSKIGDLGRAVRRGLASPHDGAPIPGDRGYAPPELLYGDWNSDWFLRCFSCDAYLLGSLVMFLVSNASATSLLLAQLDPTHHWRGWAGTYGDVLPYVREAFDKVLVSFRLSLRDEFAEEITTVVEQLCEPDPTFRGHPLNRSGSRSQYSLERYISKFDLLARRAEIGLIKSLRS